MRSTEICGQDDPRWHDTIRPSCSRSDSSGLGGLVPGGMSKSLGWLHLSAILGVGWVCETNPRQIDSHPCSLDPRACRESANRMGSCAHNSRINPVEIFVSLDRECGRFVPAQSWQQNRRTQGHMFMNVHALLILRKTVGDVVGGGGQDVFSNLQLPHPPSNSWATSIVSCLGTREARVSAQPSALQPRSCNSKTAPDLTISVTWHCILSSSKKRQSTIGTRISHETNTIPGLACLCHTTELTATHATPVPGPQLTPGRTA